MNQFLECSRNHEYFGSLAIHDFKTQVTPIYPVHTVMTLPVQGCWKNFEKNFDENYANQSISKVLIVYWFELKNVLVIYLKRLGESG